MDNERVDSAGEESPARPAHVELRRVGELQPRRGNPRTHSAKQIRQIASSIEEFGFTNPVLIESDGTVVAGHGRLAAAKRLGLERVPTLRLDHLTPEQARAYVIADNRLAENAGWDRDLLSIEIQALAEIDLGFDLEITGFETPEIDLLLQDDSDLEAPDGADDPAGLDPRSGPASSRPGDLWEIGPHRLLCGSALDREAYGRLLGRDRAQLVFTDPPYNVPIEGHVLGHGTATHPEFAMASGEMSAAQFEHFLRSALSLHGEFSTNGALHFVCMDWRHSRELLDAARGLYSEQKNVCVWVKTNGGMGSLYRSQHEFVHVFKVGTAPHVNNVELGRHGRHRTNVWRYAGANAFGADRDEALALHPTVKPVRLVSDAILDCSCRDDVVLDGFAGSGTTLLAAERTGRRGYAIEIDPHYVDVAIKRMAKHAGLEARHTETAERFDDLSERRLSESTPPSHEQESKDSKED